MARFLQNGLLHSGILVIAVTLGVIGFMAMGGVAYMHARYSHDFIPASILLLGVVILVIALKRLFKRT